MINNPYMTNSPFGSSGLQISSPLSVARSSPTFSSPIPEAPPTGGSQPSPAPNRYSNIMPSQPLEPPTGGGQTLSGGNAPPPGMMLNPNYNPTQAMLDNVPMRGSADELSRQMYIPATGGGLPGPPMGGSVPPIQELPYDQYMAMPPLHDQYTAMPPMLGGGQLLPGTIYQEPPQPKEPYYAGGGMMFNPATGKYERSPDAIKNPYYFDRFKDNAIGTADVKFSDQEYIRPEDLKNYEAQRIEDRKKYNEFLESIGQPPIPTDENQQEIATDLYTPKTGQFEDITQPSTGAPPVATQPPSGTTPPSSSGGGSVVDFLFEGEAPTPGSARETSRVELPSWYTEYAKDMLGRAKGIGNMPYEAFPGPRIAPFTETEKEGMRETVGAAESYKPYLGAAGDILGTVGGKSSFGAAAPFIGEGAGFTREAAYGTGMPIAEQYFQEALMRTPTGAAAPYAEQAARMFPEAAAAYMSPYTQGVIEELGNIGLEQLQEKFLPEIGEEFIRAGQFGGSRMGEFGARALRDVQRSILGEQRKALESGYKTAADIYGTDVGRQAELARLMGTFGGQEQEFMGDVGKTLAGIRQEDLGRILQAGGQLGDFGKLAGTLSSEDLNRLMDLSSRYADLGGLAQKYGLVGGEAITGVGEKERGMNQANLELAYKDFLEQRNYPKEQADFLAKMLAGINLPETRISETITTPAQPAGETGIEKIAGGVKGGLQIFDIIKELFGKEG